MPTNYYNDSIGYWQRGRHTQYRWNPDYGKNDSWTTTIRNNPPTDLERNARWLKEDQELVEKIHPGYSSKLNEKFPNEKRDKNIQKLFWYRFLQTGILPFKSSLIS